MTGERQPQRLTSNFDAYAADYDKMLGEACRYYIRIKLSLLRQQLNRNISSLRILDAGCGTGQAEEILDSNSRSIVGMDLAGEMLKVAMTKNTEANFVHGDVLNVPFADQSFDATFSFALMHHLKGDLKEPALTELNRVTKRGGYILTFEHNPANLITRYLVHKCVLDKKAELISPNEMVRLHRKAGLEVIGVKYLVFFPRVLSCLAFSERFLRSIPFGGQYEVIALRR